MYWLFIDIRKYFPYSSFPGQISFENVQIDQEVEIDIRIYTIANMFLNLHEFLIVYL